MNGMNRVDHGPEDAITCLTGTVVITPPFAIGATNGILIAHGHTVRIRQVPGPNNRGVPLSDVSGQLARVCGQFQPDGQLAVTFVQPLLF